MLLDNENKAELLNTGWDLSERLNWKLNSYKLASQYIECLAVKNNQCEVKYFDWGDY